MLNVQRNDSNVADIRWLEYRAAIECELYLHDASLACLITPAISGILKIDHSIFGLGNKENLVGILLRNHSRLAPLTFYVKLLLRPEPRLCIITRRFNAMWLPAAARLLLRVLKREHVYVSKFQGLQTLQTCPATSRGKVQVSTIADLPGVAHERNSTSMFMLSFT